MKIIAITLGLLLLSIVSFAQNSIGFRGAFSASTVTKFDLIENITPDFKLFPSGSGAVFLEIPITNRFSFQPELAYNQKGFSISEGIQMGGEFLGVDIPVNGKVNFRTNYIDLPLLAKVHLGPKDATHGYVMAGPAVGYMADANMRIRVLNVFPINTNLNNDFFKPIELSGIAAAGFEVPISEKFTAFAEGRYQLGFSRILDTPVVQLDVRNRSLSGGMGIKIALN